MKKACLLIAALGLSGACFAAPAKEMRIDMYGQGGADKKVVIADKGNVKLADTPKWMQQKVGGGSLVVTPISNEWQTVTYQIKSVGGGNVLFQLSGPDVRDKAGKRQPYHVDFRKVTVNGQTLLDTKDGAPVTTWHDGKKAYIYKDAKDGEVLNVTVECRSAMQ